MLDCKIVELTCGLGNQMFQYAFAKTLQKHLNEEVLLDKSWFEQEKRPMGFALDLFKTDLKYATAEQVAEAKKRITRLPGILRKILKKPKYAIANSGAFDFHSEYLSKNNFKYFVGFFQHPSYIEPVAAQIRATFAPPPPVLDSKFNRAKEQILSAKNSVFVHIRRGDYCALEWNLDLSYYHKAIAYINERVENPTFFVFSDDADFAKSLDFGVSLHYLGRMDHHAADMFLMSLCKHAIVANSTYSWWAAWLSEWEGKIVTAPTPWLLNRDDIIPKNWVKISRDGNGAKTGCAL